MTARHHVKYGIAIGNPIANILVVIAGILAIGASIVLGFVAFLAIGALVAVAAAVIAVRVWWLNRGLRRRYAARNGRPAEAEVIEGEYHVVDDDPQRP